MKVHKGDTVLVISGKDKGAKGKVLEAYPTRNKVLVEGVERGKVLIHLQANVLARAVAAQHLLQEVWGPAYRRETNYLRVYLAQLRRKLERDPARPRHLITEPGMGYRFVVST